MANMSFTLCYSLSLIGISLTGILANMAVIIAVSLNKNLRTTTNFLLLNLSCADFLDCLIAMPLRIVPSLSPESELNIPCPVILSLSMLFGGASRMNTLLIAVDRYIAIKWPFWYKRHVSRRKLLGAVVATWMLVLFISVLPVAGCGLKGNNNSTSPICFYFNTLSIPFLYVFILTFSIFPLILIIPINCFLFRASCRHMQSIQSQRQNIGIINPVSEQNIVQLKTNNSSTKKFLIQSKVARMITILVCSFVVFVAPISIIDLIQVVTTTVNIPDQLSKTAIAMIYLNTSANVFIYAGYNKEFRKTFKCMFKTARQPFLNSVERAPAFTIRKTEQTVIGNNIQLVTIRPKS